MVTFDLTVGQTSLKYGLRSSVDRFKNHLIFVQLITRAFVLKNKRYRAIAKYIFRLLSNFTNIITMVESHKSVNEISKSFPYIHKKCLRVLEHFCEHMYIPTYSAVQPIACEVNHGNNSAFYDGVACTRTFERSALR